MKYENPVILSDYSDPDVIRVGGDFYMVASSFNYVPGVPVLHSKNLVEWELVNYVLKRLPFEKFNAVRHGEGAWAPRTCGGRMPLLMRRQILLPYSVPGRGYLRKRNRRYLRRMERAPPSIARKGLRRPLPCLGGRKMFGCVCLLPLARGV